MPQILLIYDRTCAAERFCIYEDRHLSRHRVETVMIDYLKNIGCFNTVYALCRLIMVDHDHIVLRLHEETSSSNKAGKFISVHDRKSAGMRVDEYGSAVCKQVVDAYRLGLLLHHKLDGFCHPDPSDGLCRSDGSHDDRAFIIAEIDIRFFFGRSDDDRRYLLAHSILDVFLSGSCNEYAFFNIINKACKCLKGSSTDSKRTFYHIILALLDEPGRDDLEDIVYDEFIDRGLFLIVVKEPACDIVDTEKSFELITFIDRYD